MAAPERMKRKALLFLALAAAVAFGAWLPGHLSSQEKGSGIVAVPDRAKEDSRLNEEIQKLLKARYEEVGEEVQNIDRNFDRYLWLHLGYILEVYHRFLGATLDLTAQPKLRADMLAPLLKRAQKLEAMCEAPPEGIVIDPADLPAVRAFRMVVQIEILRAKRAALTGRY